MSYSYFLSPYIGVARLGNSQEGFYLAPTTTGGLPRECDANGNEMSRPFTQFKDASGRVKRQAQDFRIFRTQDQRQFEEVTLTTNGVQSMSWTVHLANKKAAWYKFQELQGNLLLGASNSYARQQVPLRNQDQLERQKLIIDPGPRTISGANQNIEIARDTIPTNYPAGNFPTLHPQYGRPIKSLGTLKTDNAGRLLVLGAYGSASGDKEITSYGGADTWYDDIADGVVNVTLKLTDQSTVQLSSWVICASPDFAPEIVNISTLDDTMFDVAVRHENLMPEMYKDGAWNTNFTANYQRDIWPIMQRISRYQWVSNVQAMSAFCSAIFDFSDPSEKNASHRKHYFSTFRQPTLYLPDAPGSSGMTLPNRQTASSTANRQDGGVTLVKPELSSTPMDAQPAGTIAGGNLTLLSPDNLPMMPLNSGSNSVSNSNIEKFLTLNQTQYFLLQQWAAGKFVNDANYTPYPVWPAARAAVGNCVGLPMCPGIEVTWNMQNPAIYAGPYTIAQHGNEQSYQQHGLTPSRDETEGGGCEPGDLTKRMAIPWQADFFNCTIQYVNFTDPQTNKVDNQPLPPTYYSYWWPPQAPWDVLTGDMTATQQAESHTPAGLQVNYIRGINSYVQMITEWSYLGFIRNQNTSETRETFPYMVETERLHDRFAYQAVPVSQISGNKEDQSTTIPVFYAKREGRSRAHLEDLRVSVEEEMFHAIAVADELLQTLPRSGTRERF